MRMERPLSNTAWTVERPVALAILRDLMDLTEISDKTPISFFGADGKNYQQGSTVGESIGGENRWSYDERLFMEVDEDFEPDYALMTPVYKSEYPAIFADKSVGVYIRPVYRKTKVTLSLRYRASDRNQAQRWRNEMTAKCSLHREQIWHTISYSYPLPTENLLMISHVHQLKENVAGAGLSLNDYYTQHLCKNCSLVTDIVGQNGVWSVAETQARVQGYFDFDSAPEKGSKDEDHDNWVITVNYVAWYMKPIATVIDYPVSIHQQLINPKYYPETKVGDLVEKMVYYSKSGAAARHFEDSYRLAMTMGLEGVRLPSHDDWVPANVKPSTVTVFTALVTITAQDKRSLFNLNDLGDFQLRVETLNWIKTVERTWLVKSFQSIFQLDLYCADDLVGDGSLMIDTQLNVSSTVDLDLTKVYHVRLSLVTDIAYLRAEAIGRLQNSPAVGAQVVQGVNAAIWGMNSTRSDVGKSSLSVVDGKILSTKKYLPTYTRGFMLHYIRSFFTIVYGKYLD